MTKKIDTRLGMATVKFIHGLGGWLINRGFELQVGAATSMGIETPSLAVRHILIQQLLAKHQVDLIEHGVDTGAPEEETLLGAGPEDITNLN